MTLNFLCRVIFNYRETHREHLRRVRPSPLPSFGKSMLNHPRQLGGLLPPAWEISFISASTYLLQSRRCDPVFTLGCTSPHNLFTCVISMRRLFSKYFPR